MTRPIQIPQQGFTLVEVLTVIAIAGILLGVAAPGLRQAADALRLRAATSQLLSELNHARAEAIRRNARVVVCKSRDLETCAEQGEWDQGWIVFHDVNNNAVRDAGEAVIRRVQGVAEGLRIVGNGTVADYVSFTGFGGPRLTSGAFQAGTITVCRASGEAAEARQLVINAVGRARIQKAALARCTP
jgi:type IV fimbrial biogenesis protein FimT